MEINSKFPNFGIYWAGFKSTLYDLYKSGWTIHVDKEYADLTYSIAINNQLLKVVELVNRINCEWINDYQRNPDRARGLRFENNHIFPTIQMQYLSFKIAINIASSNTFRYEKLQQIDIMPHQTIDLEDALGYKKSENSEIVIPDYSIPELMTLIKEKQAPKQKEIRERIRKETNPKIIKEEAKIISLDTSIYNARIA